MNADSIMYAFEINIHNLKRSMPMVAVRQSLNTLLEGDILRINACSRKATEVLTEYFSNVGHTLVRQVEIENDVTLYVRKN